MSDLGMGGHLDIRTGLGDVFSNMNPVPAKPNVALTPLLALLLITSATASAWYDPGLQRWINRDPDGEPGVELLHKSKGSRATGPAPYFNCAARRTQ
jgi:hypothetical protein